MDTEKLLKRIAYCENVIDEYGGNFDPFDALTGKESNEQKVFTLAVNFLDNIDKLMDDFTKQAEKIIRG